MLTFRQCHLLKGLIQSVANYSGTDDFWGTLRVESENGSVYESSRSHRELILD